jgi:MFS family permease
MAYANATIWGLGNGILNTYLIVYLALELDAPGLGLGIGLIKASPQLVGLLRLAAPAFLGRIAQRKPFCIGCYVASALVLLVLPAAAVPGLLSSQRLVLLTIVGLWCLYHLLEYLGTVALWAWLADLASPPVRGRFFGLRERWLIAGTIAGSLAAAAFSYGWNYLYPKEHYPDRVWLTYAIPSAIGACLLLLAIVPLAAMPDVRPRRGEVARVRAPAFREIFAPLADRRFLGFLAFGCWFGLFSGLVQTAQSIYPAKVLGMGLGTILLLQMGMRAGQFSLGPWAGRVADRLGSRRVLVACVPIVASGTAFYFLATPSHPWWFVGGWVAWIAFAGINVALPSFTFSLAPAPSRAAYYATYFAGTGVCVAAGSLLGGHLFDWLGDRLLAVPGSSLAIDRYALFFLLAWLARSLAIAPLLAIAEPNKTEATETRE